MDIILAECLNALIEPNDEYFLDNHIDLHLLEPFSCILVRLLLLSDNILNNKCALLDLLVFFH